MSDYPEHEVSVYKCSLCDLVIEDHTVEQSIMHGDIHQGEYKFCGGALEFQGKVMRKFKSSTWGDFDGITEKET